MRGISSKSVVPPSDIGPRLRPAGMLTVSPAGARRNTSHPSGKAGPGNPSAVAAVQDPAALGARATAPARQRLRAFNDRVGGLLGALSRTPDHSVDGVAGRRIMAQLHGMLPAAYSPHQEFDAEFDRSVELNLKGMTRTELVALQDGLAVVRNFLPEKELNGTKISVAVTSELELRFNASAALLLPKFTQALMQSRPGGTLATCYSRMLDWAASMRAVHGLPPTDATAARNLQMDTLASLLRQDRIKWNEVADVMAALSGEDLHAVITRGPALSSIAILAQRCLLQRRQSSGDAFVEACKTVLELSGKVGSRQAVLDSVVLAVRETADRYHDYIAISGPDQGHDVAIHPGVNAGVMMLEHDILGSGRFPFHELNTAQAQKLDSALETLGLRDGRQAIAAERDYRTLLDEAGAGFRNPAEFVERVNALADYGKNHTQQDILKALGPALERQTFAARGASSPFQDFSAPQLNQLASAFLHLGFTQGSEAVATQFKNIRRSVNQLEYSSEARRLITDARNGGSELREKDDAELSTLHAHFVKLKDQASQGWTGSELSRRDFISRVQRMPESAKDPQLFLSDVVKAQKQLALYTLLRRQVNQSVDASVSETARGLASLLEALLAAEDSPAMQLSKPRQKELDEALGLLGITKGRLAHEQIADEAAEAVDEGEAGGGFGTSILSQSPISVQEDSYVLKPTADESQRPSSTRIPPGWEWSPDKGRLLKVKNAQ